MAAQPTYYNAQSPTPKSAAERQADKTCSYIGEGIVRGAIAVTGAYLGKRWTIAAQTKSFMETASNCKSMLYSTFFSLYNDKMAKVATMWKNGKLLNCIKTDTCFNACKAGSQASSATGLLYDTHTTCAPFKEEAFKQAYYRILPKGADCSYPKKCLEVCQSALQPWDKAHQASLAAEMGTKTAWSDVIYPTMGALGAAALADTIIGASLEGSNAKELARVVVGTAITACFAPVAFEVACMYYMGYRAAFTAVRLLKLVVAG